MDRPKRRLGLHFRHAGEFCEYHACYHKDVLYCWGLKDVQFLPCNGSAIGGHVDPETVKDPAWYCPCGEGRRTPPPYSHCVCTEGYAGEFCNKKICEDNGGCSDSAYGNGPYFNNNGNATGIVVPDSVKVAMVCMSMVVLVAVFVWLKRMCLRKRLIQEAAETGSESAPDLRVHYGHGHQPLTPAQLSATLLMLQSRQYQCEWEMAAPNRRRRGNRPNPPYRSAAPLPTYDEANSAPPPYSSIMAQKKLSTISAKSAGRKVSTLSDAEAGVAGVMGQTSGGPAGAQNEGPPESVVEACPKTTAGRRRSV